MTNLLLTLKMTSTQVAKMSISTHKSFPGLHQHGQSTDRKHN